MAESVSSTLTRHRAAIAVCATLAAVGSVWYLLLSDPHLEGSKRLRRSNAVRRSNTTRRRHDEGVIHSTGAGDTLAAEQGDALVPDPRHVLDGGEPQQQSSTASTAQTWSNAVDVVSEPETEDDEIENADDENLPVQADDNLTEHDIDDTQSRTEGQRLEVLAYQIAKYNHDREGVIHHGVTCDECGSLPIKGPRYHCNNCPDFDLCEKCEATDCHLRTHVFTKIKIPAPWGGKAPQPVWYPGTPHKMPATLDSPDSRALRNALSRKSELELNQIDGLWLQFTCMATPDPSYPGGPEDFGGFTISRTAFNQCFLAQTTPGMEAAPSLIRDRLFALYDTENKGTITFDNYVMGTALTHGTTPELRKKRIFHGLDLDDDGYISRKDCKLMFKSYYNLNRDVLLGYMEVDRFAENALQLQADQDPKDHIAGGRSLASYFESGFPPPDRPPPWQTTFLGGKHVDVNGDTVPNDDAVPITRRDHEQFDKLNPTEIARGHHLKLNWLFHDEMLRLCSTNEMRYLTQHQVRAFKDPQDVSNRPWFRWHRGDVWIADQAHAGKRAYFLVESQDLEGEENWRENLNDFTFCQRLHKKVSDRLMDIELWDAILTKGDEKLLLQEQRLKLGVEDGTHYSTPHLNNAEDANHDQQTSEADSFVGGTAASHTIYLAVRDALDELLDDLFALKEKLAWKVAETAQDRQAHSAQIQGYLETLFERRWMANKYKVTQPDERTETQGTSLEQHEAVISYRYSVRSGGGRGAAMVHNFQAMETHKGTWKDIATDDFGWKCLYWTLEIDAEMLIEEEADESWKQKRMRRSSFATARTSSRVTTTAERDPTMPQFMPNSVQDDVDASWPDGKSSSEPSQGNTEATQSTPLSPLTPQRLKYLALFEAVDRRHKSQGGAAKLSFEDFEVQLLKMDDKGDSLLAWIGGWTDLVNF